MRELVAAEPDARARAGVRVLHELAELESAGLDEALAGTRTAHERLRSIVGLMRGFMDRDRAARGEPVDLRGVLREARALSAAQLVGADVDVLDEPAWGVADRSLLLQILQNLCANAAHAAKTLSSPQVRLHCYVSGEWAIVSVRDNGPGIESALHARIFEPFYTTRRGAGGTGLGLALCREYARRMGAELSLWSAPGRGACFRVMMPRAR